MGELSLDIMLCYIILGALISFSRHKVREGKKRRKKEGIFFAAFVVGKRK